MIQEREAARHARHFVSIIRKQGADFRVPLISPFYSVWDSRWNSATHIQGGSPPSQINLSGNTLMIHPEKCVHRDSKGNQVFMKVNHHSAHFKCWFCFLFCFGVLWEGHRWGTNTDDVTQCRFSTKHTSPPSTLLFCPCTQLSPFLILSGAKNAIGELVYCTGFLLCICPSMLICSGRAIQAPSNSVHTTSGRAALKRHRVSLQWAREHQLRVAWSQWELV